MSAPPPRSLHGRVNQTAHQRADIFALAGGLDHEDGQQVFLRVDPEQRAGQPPQKN